MSRFILHPLRLKELAKTWILEDTSHFDFGGGVVGNTEAEFNIFMKSSGTLAGIPFADAVFSELGVAAKWLFEDGDWINPISIIAIISGPANKLLLAERIVLNILSRASGIATGAAQMFAELLDVGWKGILAGTRKTTPGFRMVEKYALLVGGADMHRYDLSSMVMLKDNHISISGSVGKAIEKVRRFSGFSSKIEVECRTLEEAIEAGKASCDVIMLDNFDPEDLKKAALALKLQFPNILIEASGGITASNVANYTNPWIDIISSSLLVQGYSTLDFSMKVKNQ